MYEFVYDCQQRTELSQRVAFDKIWALSIFASQGLRSAWNLISNYIKYIMLQLTKEAINLNIFYCLSNDKTIRHKQMQV